MTTVDADVKNNSGRVVIPAGSTVELVITEISPAKSRSAKDGTLTLRVADVTVRGKSYPLDAVVSSVSHTLQGRGVTAGEVEKTAAGAAIGAVAGRVIGGDSKGTIIGAVIGGAGGAVVAERDREPRRGHQRRITDRVDLDRSIDRGGAMNRSVALVVGIVMIGFGAFVLLQGADFTTKRDVLRVGDVKITADQKQSVPPWAAGVAVAAGIVILVGGARKWA